MVRVVSSAGSVSGTVSDADAPAPSDAGSRSAAICPAGRLRPSVAMDSAAGALSPAATGDGAPAALAASAVAGRGGDASAMAWLRQRPPERARTALDLAPARGGRHPARRRVPHVESPLGSAAGRDLVGISFRCGRCRRCWSTGSACLRRVLRLRPRRRSAGDAMPPPTTPPTTTATSSTAVTHVSAAGDALLLRLLLLRLLFGVSSSGRPRRPRPPARRWRRL